MKPALTKIFKLEFDAWVIAKFHDKNRNNTVGDFYTVKVDDEDLAEVLYNNLENNKRYRITFEQLDDEE